MRDVNDLAEWERIAALIEECRAEREACETIREQVDRGGACIRSVYAAVTERLLAGVGGVHAPALQDDRSP